MFSIGSLGYDSQSYWQSNTTHYSSFVYDLACSIFRVLVMSFQYAAVRLIAAVRHLPIFPSALPSNKLIVISRNISNLNVLWTCLKTAWTPERRDDFQGIGEIQGLRITHDVILRPASGICLGKSLAFLSEYGLEENEIFLNRLRAAAERVEEGSNEKCVRMQAIYDALIGFEGQVNAYEKDLLLRVLKGEDISNKEETNQEILSSIHSFLAQDDQPETLRHYVLNDMEDQGVKLDVNLYALILELDTIWHLHKHPSMKKNDSTHLAILQAVAHCLNLEPANASRMHGSISAICSQLEELEEGSYLIHFANHTLACIKEEESLAIFDPNEGLAYFDEAEQKDGIMQLLEFYGFNQSVSLNLIEMHPN